MIVARLHSVLGIDNFIIGPREWFLLWGNERRTKKRYWEFETLGL